jgi:sugar lactone lactonase YvrE
MNAYRIHRGIVTGALTVAALLAGCSGHGRPAEFSPQWDKLVVEVARFDHDQPTGVAVAPDGRVFACFPNWSARPTFAVAEILPDGGKRPYPSASWNRWSRHSRTSALRSFVCAQALHIDDEGFLWILDSGNPDIRNGVVLAGPKLFKINLADDTVAQVYYFDHERDMARHSYLSDFAIDTKHQFAYITDSQGGSLFIVDLRTRAARSVLVGHASTTAEPGVMPRIGSERWRSWFGRTPQYGANAIALAPDGAHLFYAPMTGRTLYRIPAAVLRMHNATDQQLASHVEKFAALPSIIDGMHMTRDGMLYMTALEMDAIIRIDTRDPISIALGGETFVADPRLQWPDSLAMGADGYLYFTASMTHLRFPHRDRDRTEQPFYVLKASIAHVDRAAKLWRQAQAAQAQADDAEARALAAAREADARRAAAARRHDEAMRREAAAARAHQQADAAGRVTADRLEAAEDAARLQADTAALAAETAELAKMQAARAKLAAESAAQAAAAALREAAVAIDEMNRTRAAMAHAAATGTLAAEASATHERAVAAAEQAQRLADSARRLADARRADADAALRAADEAAADAQREVAQATQLAGRAAALRHHAQAVATDALDAELVEINARTPAHHAVRTADVPTHVVE